MATVINAQGSNWTKTRRNRKCHAVSIYGYGFGNQKAIRFRLVRDAKGDAEEQMDLAVLGEVELRKLANLISRVLESEADFVADLTPFDHLGPPPELEPPPVGYRDETGVAWHMK